jgi:hypothetical protein
VVTFFNPATGNEVLLPPPLPPERASVKDSKSTREPDDGLVVFIEYVVIGFLTGIIGGFLVYLGTR